MGTDKRKPPDEGLNRMRKGGVNSPPPADVKVPPPPPPQRRVGPVDKSVDRPVWRQDRDEQSDRDFLVADWRGLFLLSYRISDSNWFWGVTTEKESTEYEASGHEHGDGGSREALKAAEKAAREHLFVQAARDPLVEEAEAPGPDVGDKIREAVGKVNESMGLDLEVKTAEEVLSVLKPVDVTINLDGEKIARITGAGDKVQALAGEKPDFSQVKVVCKDCGTQSKAMAQDDGTWACCECGREMLWDAGGVMVNPKDVGPAVEIKNVPPGLPGYPGPDFVFKTTDPPSLVCGRCGGIVSSTYDAEEDGLCCQACCAVYEVQLPAPDADAAEMALVAERQAWKEAATWWVSVNAQLAEGVKGYAAAHRIEALAKKCEAEAMVHRATFVLAQLRQG